MNYYDLDFDSLDHKRDVVHDEVVYAKQHQNTSIPLDMDCCDAVAKLLRELGEIAMNAPGGHQFLINEANTWAGALTATAPRS